MRSKELLLTREGIKIRAWLSFPEPKPKGLSPALVFCHGIPGSRPDPNDRGYLPLVEAFTGEGMVCATFNFRGCGLSEGNIDMRGWYDDLGAVMEAVFDSPHGIDLKSIHCIGFSAGGAIAAKFSAYEERVSSLLLMATPHNFADILPKDAKLLRDHFIDIGTIRDHSFPPDLTRWYKDFLDVEPAKFLPLVSPRPVGIVHGENDTTVPPEHAHLLFESACHPKKLTILDGAGHQLRKDARTEQIIRSWLNEVG
jgi:pimeloyl-ACP methyl ester carboxylesterase